MPRPELYTVTYFPHFIGDGKKMFFIEKKYGNDGYATWFKILEKIANTHNHFLNLNEEEEIMFLSAKCNVSDSRLLDIITDLSKIGAFDKKLWQVKIIWCQKFIDEIQEVYKRRNNKCIHYEGLCEHLLSLGILKPTNGSIDVNDNTQSRVEYSKVEQSRVKKSRVELPKQKVSGDEKTEIYNLTKDIYLDFYDKTCGSGAYYFQAVDGVKLKSILKKLIFKMKEKSSAKKESFSKEEIGDAMKYFLSKGYETADDWLKANFTLPIIDSKLNTIFTSIKNEGTTTRRNGHNSTDAVLAAAYNLTHPTGN